MQCNAKSCEGPNADGSLTAKELQTALRTMQRGKSPGMDGLPYEFYLTFWADLAEPLTDAVNEQFLGTSPSPCYDWRFTVGIVSLIFKGTVEKPLPADAVASYRPITLLNSDYKLVAKAIALRIAPALDTVIDGTQTAFVPGRWIGDNVLYHLGIIDMLCPDPPAPNACPPAAAAPPPGAPRAPGPGGADLPAAQGGAPPDPDMAASPAAPATSPAAPAAAAALCLAACIRSWTLRRRTTKWSGNGSLLASKNWDSGPM